MIIQRFGRGWGSEYFVYSLNSFGIFFLRIHDEVCVFFYLCDFIQCNKYLKDDQRFIVKKTKKDTKNKYTTILIFDITHPETWLPSLTTNVYPFGRGIST